ncbi:hypothetical protein [Deinococcus multiflagellatus]|uniref:hypothetical protein n=1 Tax=Deinococcus multiflagellatus TaxID=1656887 RepID=UPI001CCCBFCD|nr:hypothetical protein [Deinococcus multiflagellatus]MBZ9712820.1 hypothetical protein [Deinococcus multiflagellatus]
MLPAFSLAPEASLSASAYRAFEAAWAARDPDLLPAGVARWHFLQWLAGQGFLLHGSAQANLTRFEPRTPHDLSADDFSKRTGVFAASDGLWAMMYALRDRVRTARMLNMAVQVRQEGGWSPTGYFLSLAPRRPLHLGGPALLVPGWVYVLPRTGFEPMPPYDWPGLGRVREPHWVSAQAAVPLLRVPVGPADFPLPVHTHDAATVDARAHANPWGFPWGVGEGT